MDKAVLAGRKIPVQNRFFYVCKCGINGLLAALFVKSDS